MGRGLRAPVRPTTPPQLRLNLDFGTAKQREEYAREVLTLVHSIEEARARSGAGSAYISAEDKMGSINDEFAAAREEARWRRAQEHDRARRAEQMQSARSNPERERTESRVITFHPQPRARPPQSARPAAAGQWGEELHSPARPRTSMASSSTFLTGTDFVEDDAPAAHHRGAEAAGSRMPAPGREERLLLRADPALPSGMTVVADETMWERAERAPFHTTMDPAEVDDTMKHSRARWGSRPTTAQIALEHMEDYVRLDRASQRRCAAEAQEEEMNRLTKAHYSQKGLPYLIKASAELTSNRLDKLRDSTAHRKSRVGSILNIARQSRGPEHDKMRETITDAICEDNKVLQRTSGDGRMSIAPASRAAERVSQPGPLEWAQTSIPWQIDPYTGDWYRADKPYRRGDGIMMPKDIATQPPYLTQGRDNVRALVNRVKLPGRPTLGARDRNRGESSGRRSADGWVKMGGGFVYRSNIQIDPARPTPSRPSYSHGLFLFPFSSEDAAKMLDDTESNSSANQAPVPAAIVKDATSAFMSARGMASSRGRGRSESADPSPRQQPAHTSNLDAHEQLKSQARASARVPSGRPGQPPAGGQAYVVSITRSGEGRQPPERPRS